MAFAVELFPDPDTEAAVRTMWRALADAGLSRTLLEIGSYPHVSLADCGDLDADRFRPVLQAFAGETPPLEFVLASVGVFPTGEGVIFLAPVVTRRLLDLHQTFHIRFSGFGAVSSAYYLPGNWVPHCTLATGVAAAAMLETVRVCLENTRTIRGRFERVALVEFRPVKVVYAFSLTGG